MCKQHAREATQTQKNKIRENKGKNKRNESLKAVCATINQNWPHVIVFRLIIQLVKNEDGKF